MAKSSLAVMGPSGHKKIEWDPETGEGVDAAKAAFDKVKGNMMMFEKVADANGDADFQRIKEFNPNAKELLAVPPLAGG